MRALAKIINILFHPLLIPSYAFLLAYLLNPILFAGYDSVALSKIFLTVFINTFVFPAIALLLTWQLRFVKSLKMNEGKDRIVPYLVCGLFYTWGYVVFRNSGLPQILNIILLGGCITLFVIFFINIFRPASIQTGAMGMMLMFMLLICLLSDSNAAYVIMLTALAAGMVGSSRLILNRHDSTAIYIGYFVGIMAQLVAFQFF